MTDPKVLLAVLDLPKIKQFYALYKRGLIDAADYDEVISAVTEEQRDRLIDRIFATLAFRLRDEVCKDSLGCDNYHKALCVVFRSFCKSQEGTIRQNLIPYELWLESFITAIERIIAALIAKGE